MTDEEALTLKKGDVVWIPFRGYPAGGRATVRKIRNYRCSDGKSLIRVIAKRIDSGNANLLHRKPKDVSLYCRYDPTNANVFADWLEEQGEVRAAHLLREAFPFCDGEKETVKGVAS